MNSQELRIGNLVNLFKGIDDNGPHFEQIEIAGVMLDIVGDFYYLDPIHQNWIFSTQNLEPIPLTEEWLLKFGFELEYKGQFAITYTHSKPNEIGYHWNKNFGWAVRYYGHSISCDYVHQLQNLYFCLTGAELTMSSSTKETN